MKKLFVIFLVIVGIYILFTTFTTSSGLPLGKKSQQAEITEKIDSIEFDISGADMTLIPTDRHVLEAELKGKGRMTVDKNGDTVEVVYKQPWLNWFSFNQSSELIIHIPKDYNKDMSFYIGSGSIDFSGESPLQLDELKINLGSGDVNLGSLSVKEFIGDVSSGSLEIDSLITKEGSFNISSGNVKVNNYKGKLDVDVSSGDLDIVMAQLTDSIEIDVSSGDVAIDLPKDADFTLEGRVSSGDLITDFPLTNQVQKHDDIEGMHGKGTHKIDVEISSGSVKIY